MDSYSSSYRDPSVKREHSGRSPRRDSRARDDSYRGRSPGTFDETGALTSLAYILGRERRRSRSPNTSSDRHDRYDGRRRDDYRDRDDRRRSPPGGIDRYVPGQDDVPGMTVNPIADPAKLQYQVGYSYYSEWWRINEKIKEDKERLKSGRRREPERPRGADDKDREKTKIQIAYDAYKENLQAKMARAFVSDHKKEQWFKERYDPDVSKAFRQNLNEFRRGAYSQWEQDLESGTFDDYSLEGIPKSESNGTGGFAEKEEGEFTATHEILGVGDLVPANGADIRDENIFQPTLLIKTIAPSVSRHNLETFCRDHLGEEEGGFKWLSLSDPNPSKRFHRIGWVMLHPSSEHAAVIERGDPVDDDGDVEIKPAPVLSTADKALEAVNGKTVKDGVRGDFVCHVGVHNPPQNPRKKALWDLFSSPDRIEKDLELAQRLVNKYEEDFGSDFNAWLKVTEKVEELRLAGRLGPFTSVTPTKRFKQSKLGMDEAAEDGEDGEDGEEIGEDDEEEGAIDDDEADSEDLLVKKKQLDLMVEYLRRVFNFCFFCVFESDSIHELTRKCAGGHLRRPRTTLSSSSIDVARASANGEPFPGKKRTEPTEEGELDVSEGERKFKHPTTKSEQQLLRAYNWVKTFEDKIAQILEPDTVDIRKLGGRRVDDAVQEELANYVKQEDEGKWRCKVPECAKLFKESHFWKKHVEKRHPEWLSGLEQEVSPQPPQNAEHY